MREELLRELEAWGCGVEDAMPRFLGDRDFYGECAVELAAEFDIEGLLGALRTGDRQRALDIAHDLKGCSGNLGVTPIYEPTCRLVQLLRRNKLEEAMACLSGIERSCREYTCIVQRH